jgi:hypothetical protein
MVSLELHVGLINAIQTLVSPWLCVRQLLKCLPIMANNVTDSPLNITWQPPSFDILSQTFPDFLCQPAAIWFAAYLNSNQDDVATSADDQSNVFWGLSISEATTMNYLYALLNTTDPNSLPPSPTYATLMAWYTESESFPGFLLDIVPETCVPEICQSLNWQGDQDVSGIGMIGSYYVLAVKVTLYFFVAGWAKLFRSSRTAAEAEKVETGPLRRKRRGIARVWDLCLVGFRCSAPTFLDAALIFSVSMVFAAIFRFGQVVQNPLAHYQVSSFPSRDMRGQEGKLTALRRSMD